jgi:hypothetical protein
VKRGESGDPTGPVEGDCRATRDQNPVETDSNAVDATPAAATDQSGPSTPHQRRRLTPVKAIRLTCVACSAGCTSAVRDCPITDCPLWEYRMGKRPPKGKAKRTPMQAIRAKCLELNDGSAKLVREEGVPYPINPWRLGKRPPVEETYYTEADKYDWFPWLCEEEHKKDGASARVARENATDPPSTAATIRGPDSDEKSAVGRGKNPASGISGSEPPDAITTEHVAASAKTDLWHWTDPEIVAAPWRHVRPDELFARHSPGRNHAIVASKVSEYTGETLFQTACYHDFPEVRTAATENLEVQRCPTCERPYREARQRLGLASDHRERQAEKQEKERADVAAAENAGASRLRAGGISREERAVRPASRTGPGREDGPAGEVRHKS